jgi:hypothetical protein
MTTLESLNAKVVANLLSFTLGYSYGFNRYLVRQL